MAHFLLINLLMKQACLEKYGGLSFKVKIRFTVYSPKRLREPRIKGIHRETDFHLKNDICKIRMIQKLKEKLCEIVMYFPLWCENILCKFSIFFFFFNLLRCVFWPRMWYLDDSPMWAWEEFIFCCYWLDLSN